MKKNVLYPRYTCLLFACFAPAEQFRLLDALLRAGYSQRDIEIIMKKVFENGSK